MTGRVMRHVSLRHDLGGESCRCLGEGGDESRRLLGPNDPSQADRVSTRAAGQVSGRPTRPPAALNLIASLGVGWVQRL
jgi:hypothetical protein